MAVLGDIIAFDMYPKIWYKCHNRSHYFWANSTRQNLLIQIIINRSCMVTLLNGYKIIYALLGFMTHFLAFRKKEYINICITLFWLGSWFPYIWALMGVEGDVSPPPPPTPSLEISVQLNSNSVLRLNVPKKTSKMSNSIVLLSNFYWRQYFFNKTTHFAENQILRFSALIWPKN